MTDTVVKIHSLLEAFGHERRIHYNLDTFKAALLDIGSPEKNVQSLVIAGTNGKGTVTLLTTNALVQGGKRVATYMSPHLISITERFLFNAKPIAEAELLDLILQHHSFGLKHRLSYFEFLTLLFFSWAKQIQSDVLILEVGLGGRLDATNVTHPKNSAVTSIDFDHMNILGNSLEEILHEKISIVPRGGTLISGIKQPSLVLMAQEWCRKQNALFLPSGDSIKATLNRDWDWQEATLKGTPFKLKNPNPRWIENANTAYTLVKSSFRELSDSLIIEAFSRTIFPGRFECIPGNPFVAGKPLIVLSGDHNPAGIASLVETLQSLSPRKIHTLCAFSLDKPFSHIFETLKSISTSITLTTFPNQGSLPKSYLELSETPIVDPANALDSLLKKAKPQDVVLITGSLYLVGAVKALGACNNSRDFG